jgi:quercetin dioxygenase-like cupin family protein
MKHILLSLLGILIIAAVISHAQQPAAPPVPGAAPAPNSRAGNSAVMDANGLLVQRRRFDAGNRTFWHSHDRGFLILVEEGRARVQKKGEPMKELRAGETDYTPPNVVHWHGASANEGFVQVGVSFGGEIKFLDPVTDAEYQGK